MSKSQKKHAFSVLSHFQQTFLSSDLDGNEVHKTLSGELFGSDQIVSIDVDLAGKALAMSNIANHPFVQDADCPEFAGVQQWISECGHQVALPINFCGGVLLMRLCRRLVPRELQSEQWAKAVQQLAAAYDFAFLALGHADDESDMTHERDGALSRWKSHPDTRAVDGINLLLAGVTSAQDVLDNWPQDRALRRPNSPRILREFFQALREASFPILFDRVGAGHVGASTGGGRHKAFKIDHLSLVRIEMYSKYRAHTYFLRATWMAVLVSGYETISPDLENILDRLFKLLGSIGAASDDLQDIFIDLSSGVHSVVSVMAHLCVAEEENLRPQSRINVDAKLLTIQRNRLNYFITNSEVGVDKLQLLNFLEEIELRAALRDHFDGQCVEFSETMYEAVTNYGFSVELMSEIVAFVCRDSNFAIPDKYMSALITLKDDNMKKVAHQEIGKFISKYFLDRFWPTVENKL